MIGGYAHPGRTAIPLKPGNPNQFAGCKFWFRSDSIQEAQREEWTQLYVKNPSNVNGAGWTQKSCTATADTITDTADSVATYHDVAESISDVVVNANGIDGEEVWVYAEVAAGTLDYGSIRLGGSST